MTRPSRVAPRARHHGATSNRSRSSSVSRRNQSRFASATIHSIKGPWSTPKQSQRRRAQPQIFPLTVAAAKGGNELAKLVVSAALTQEWPALIGLEGAPAYNVGRAYAAFAADTDNGTQTVAGLRRRRPAP